MSDDDDRPSRAKSHQVIQDTIKRAGPGFFVQALAEIHFGQAVVIRGERVRAERAEAEVARQQAFVDEVAAEWRRDTNWEQFGRDVGGTLTQHGLAPGALPADRHE